MKRLHLLFVPLLIAACDKRPDEVSVDSADKSAPKVTTAPINTEPSKSYDAAYAAANAAIEAAASRGHAWSTSDALLDEAADTADAGNEEQAIALADEARIHAELAAVQADRESEAWRTRVIAD